DLNVIRGAVGAAIEARDYDYATSLLGQALEWYPREPRLYYLVGEVARSQGDTATARRSLQTAQALREQEIAAAAMSMASPAGRNLTTNPFRNLGPAAGSVAPAAASQNPFRPAGGKTSSKNPFGDPRASGAVHSASDVAAASQPSDGTVQIASADLAYVLPPAP